MTGNAKHQAAIAASAQDTETLRLEINSLVIELVELAAKLEPLASTKASIGFGFLSQRAQETRLKQEKAERLALRVSASDMADSALGLDFMRASAGRPSGPIAAPVTITPASCLAEILFALQQHVRKIQRNALIAARSMVPGSKPLTDEQLKDPKAVILAYHKPIDAPDDFTIPVLAERLDLYTQVIEERPTLRAIIRDLTHLRDMANEVVNPSKTNFGDPCPWCDRPTLTVFNPATSEQHIRITCEGDHACFCDDQWCACQRNTTKDGHTFRHEWINTGRASNPIGGRSRNALVQLIADRKETARLETINTDAVERIRELHYQEELAPFIQDCDVATHRHHDGPVCLEGSVAAVICGHCYDLTADYRAAAWPCPTIQALEPPTAEGEAAR